MTSIYRKEKVRMFLTDYYLADRVWKNIARMIGGPLLILIGVDFYIKNYDQFTLAYSGFCIGYGTYFMLKPFLWMLLRRSLFNKEQVEVTVNDHALWLRSGSDESKIQLSNFKKIKKRRNYFSFIYSDAQVLRIPKRILTSNEITQITECVK